MNATWHFWRCTYCGGEDLAPANVADVTVWLVETHGYGKCVPPDGFIDGDGI